jgi:hypothetical protein
MAILLAVLGALVVLPAFAASPLTYSFGRPEIFRHVLETGDWLMLSPMLLTPQQQLGVSDTFSVTIAGGALSDPIYLTNRVLVTGLLSDFAVVADGTTTITSACTLGVDAQTMNCTNTGLGNGAHTLVVTYRSGWGAYSGDDVIVRLRKNTTVVAQTLAPAIGCMITGLYLSAADVATAGLSWQGGTVNVKSTASPSVWATPYTVTRADIVWHSDATHADTQNSLTPALRSMLTGLESNPACGVNRGTYVLPTGITLAGGTIAIGGFGRIQQVIPEAFLSSLRYPQTPPTPQTFSRIEAVDAAAVGTSVRTGFGAINPAFNVGFTFVIALIAGGIVFFKWHSTLFAFLTAWCILLLGKLMFGPDIPTPVVFLPIAIIFGLGLMHLVSDRIFAR